MKRYFVFIRCRVNVQMRMDLEWFTDQNVTKKTLISQWYINILSIKHKILQSQVFVFRCYSYFVMCIYFSLSSSFPLYLCLGRSLSFSPVFIPLSLLSYPHSISVVYFGMHEMLMVQINKSRDNSNKFWLYFMLFSSFTEILSPFTT